MQKVHEHIIRMSKPSDEASLQITRQDLWGALMFFATHPEDFIEALDSAEIDEDLHPDGKVTLSRTLDFRPYHVKDKVLTEPENKITFEIQESESIPASKFEIQIEEPEQNVFFLRFTYYEDTAHKSLEGAAQYQSLRTQAWENKDLDVCQKLILMITDGAFAKTKH